MGSEGGRGQIGVYIAPIVFPEETGFPQDPFSDDDNDTYLFRSTFEIKIFSW